MEIIMTNEKVATFQVSEKISRLATFMYQKRASAKKGYTILLGAGASIESGGMNWANLSKIALREMGIDVLADDDPIEYLTKKILPDNPEASDRYLTIAPRLLDLNPSMGLRHMAQLVADGYIDTIVTTNFDTLVEKALSKFFNISQMKILVRGEVPDDMIARYLSSETPRIKIVKLHGDLVSQILFVTSTETRSFSPALERALVKLFDDGLIIVGHQLQDRDLINTIAQTSRGAIYYVNPQLPPKSSFADNLLAENRTICISDDEGKTDEFFTKLDMFIHKKQSDTADITIKKDIEQAILDKQERGRGYINYNTISDWVEQFSKKVLRTNPDLVLFVNDPTAPGGMELKKRMERYLKEKVEVDDLMITGEKGSRTFNRKVRSYSSMGAQNADQYERVFILDAITFSGNTLRLAKEWAESLYPNAVVNTGVLVISQQLIEHIQTTEGHPLSNIVYLSITDRHEIFFPWGHTHTTSDFDRKFRDVSGYKAIQISKRPWGTIEILASELICSVRLLTIEADNKLSFQRHLVRDELFVALDDNIGLDVCGEALEEPFNPYDAKIKSDRKSVV